MPKAKATRAPVQDRSRQTLERIVRAVETMLETRSFDSIGVDDIARRARCSTGSFYARFPSKDSLLPYVYARYDAELRPRIAARLGAIDWNAMTLREMCDRAATEMCDLYAERRYLLRAMSLYARAKPDAVDADTKARRVDLHDMPARLLRALRRRSRTTIRWLPRARVCSSSPPPRATRSSSPKRHTLLRPPSPTRNSNRSWDVRYMPISRASDFPLRRGPIFARALLAVPLMFTTPKQEPIKWGPGQLRSLTGDTLAVDTGRVEVPESRTGRSTAKIQLAVMRIRSTAARPSVPIIYLAGGPGNSGFNSARGEIFPVIKALREHADVIIYDQRGTGLTLPSLVVRATLGAPLDEPVLSERSRAAMLESARASAAEVKARGIDLTSYNTVENADDLDACAPRSAPKESWCGAIATDRISRSRT